MEELKTITKGFFNAGTITKIIIAGLIVLAFFGYFYLENKKDNTILKEIQKSKGLIKCINNAYQEAKDAWEDDFSLILGNLLAENGIKFPQSLNKAYNRFEALLDKIKDCLILPEDTN